MTSLDAMQVWVEAFLAQPALNSELRHRLLWDVVYRRNNGSVN